MIGYNSWVVGRPILSFFKVCTFLDRFFNQKLMDLSWTYHETTTQCLTQGSVAGQLSIPSWTSAGWRLAIDGMLTWEDLPNKNMLKRIWIGSFNPFQNYKSKCESSLIFGVKNKKLCLKPQRGKKKWWKIECNKPPSPSSFSAGKSPKSENLQAATPKKKLPSTFISWHFIGLGGVGSWWRLS